MHFVKQKYKLKYKGNGIENRESHTKFQRDKLELPEKSSPEKKKSIFCIVYFVQVIFI